MCMCGTAQCQLRRGMCDTCYQRWRRQQPAGSLQDHTSPSERFWSKVAKSGQCWEWTGARSSNGRGVVRWAGRATLAYRVSWELEHGAPPPADRLVCHQCDNPLCVRPDHLFLGTSAANVRDMDSKGRRRTVVVSGEAHHSATVADTDVRLARELFAEGGVSTADLAARFGVATSAIRRWVSGASRLDAGGPTCELTPRRNRTAA